MTAANSRVAIIWSRFGPYHLARLRAAAEAGNQHDAEIHGIEVAERDSIYQWNPCKSGNEFVRHTVFPGQDYASLSSRMIADATVRTLEIIQPDIIAVNGWSAPEACAAIDWSAGRKITRTIVMSETKEDDARRPWWKETIKRRRLNTCHAALVGGQAQKDYLVKLDLAKDRIFLGYDVVDNGHFGSGASDARAKAASLRWQLSLPDKFFFTCTRFLPRKNVDGLLKAYSAYRGACGSHPWSLVIAGSGSEETRLRKLEKELRLEGVLWVGFQQYHQLPQYYGLATAFIHPAKSEPWGLVVNEAAASGLPLLISRTVGARYELVRDHFNGLLFDPNSVADICEALLRISRLPSHEVEDMGRRSLEVANDWTPRKFGEGLFNAAEAAVG